MRGRREEKKMYIEYRNTPEVKKSYPVILSWHASSGVLLYSCIVQHIMLDRELCKNFLQMTFQHFLQVNALCRSTCWNCAVIPPYRPHRRWCGPKTELLEQQCVSKSSLEDFKCLLCCSKNDSCFMLPLTYLAVQLNVWRTIWFKKYFSNRELRLLLKETGYGRVDIKSAWNFKYQ